MKRECRVARCCGVKYCQWMPVGSKEWRWKRKLLGVVCFKCGGRLEWERTDGTNRSASLRRYRTRRTDHLAKGLTAHGTVRVRRYREGDPKEVKRQQWRERAERLAAIGLTTRGTPRKHSWIGRPANEREIAWRMFRQCGGEMAPPGDEEVSRCGGLGETALPGGFNGGFGEAALPGDCL